ncbi:hypothetical protein SODALDRAFT_361220 [Sodiomyces alkalinus F11]|uniref:Uncharacterized protein n=1 Tax=Sodiomyces alkalinus (strain CBS 110278 / VKM F-3762 / F11) TaxID=1314773 RepID=A0A3N2PSL6_SODAK|nr:hypothetical protein SODALDRAFT_361220 [Sodiomyces alkalinus F11]ROT37511.1 hypothetical protein SODALDRAFT_361220 [Sodiomyces alkalinus F11]
MKLIGRRLTVSTATCTVATAKEVSRLGSCIHLHRLFRSIERISEQQPASIADMRKASRSTTNKTGEEVRHCNPGAAWPQQIICNHAFVVLMVYTDSSRNQIRSSRTIRARPSHEVPERAASKAFITSQEFSM